MTFGYQPDQSPGIVDDGESSAMVCVSTVRNRRQRVPSVVGVYQVVGPDSGFSLIHRAGSMAAVGAFAPG